MAKEKQIQITPETGEQSKRPQLDRAGALAAAKGSQKPKKG